LVEQHRERLYTFVRRHIGHPDDAEEIAQEAFVQACEAISRFRGESQLSTWLYGIAMNLVRNYLSRAPHRVHTFVGEETLATVSDSRDPVEERVDRERALARLAAELGNLAPEMREVLLMVALDELSYEEAATLLSIPIGTVRSRVFRARAALKERLAADIAAL
jgi:RNA polymerase sigma-70 factor (ECF subfamily)